MSKTNNERIEFLRAFYRLKTSEARDYEVFEALQEAFAGIYGHYVFIDFNAFRCAKTYYSRTKRDLISTKYVVKKPEVHDKFVICPGCRAKLELK